MSWNDYVNAFLINNTDQNTGKVITNACQHAAIIGNTDGTVWASSAGFTLANYTVDLESEDGKKSQVNVNEFANLVDAFNNKGVSSAQGGIRIHKEKYFIVSFDSEKNLMFLRKNGGGACVGKSNLAFVIATFSANLKENNNGVEVPQNPGDVNKCCDSLVTFLLDNNL
jgi:hypothetical protein